MCGRFFMDKGSAQEIGKIIRPMDRKLKIEHAGDVRPSHYAAVIKELL